MIWDDIDSCALCAEHKKHSTCTPAWAYVFTTSAMAKQERLESIRTRPTWSDVEGIWERVTL
jgi:hypothetical protein